MTNDGLERCTWEDLENRLGLDLLLAKQIATVFRAKDIRKVFVTELIAKKMGIPELLSYYQPTTSDIIIKRLHHLSSGMKCIIFDGDVVEQKQSHILIRQIRDGFPEIKELRFEGYYYKTYSVGEAPTNYVNENPLFPGNLLRHDETCDRTNLSWYGVADKVRNTLFLAVTETKELTINGMEHAARMINMARRSTSKEEVSRHCPKADNLLAEKIRAGITVNLRKRKANAWH